MHECTCPKQALTHTYKVEKGGKKNGLTICVEWEPVGQLSENVPQSGGPGGITVHARVSVSLLLREN